MARRSRKAYTEAGICAELSHRGGLVVEVDDDTCGEVHRVVGVLVHREALVGHEASPTLYIWRKKRARFRRKFA